MINSDTIIWSEYLASLYDKESDYREEARMEAEEANDESRDRDDEDWQG